MRWSSTGHICCIHFALLLSDGSYLIPKGLKTYLNTLTMGLLWLLEKITSPHQTTLRSVWVFIGSSMIAFAWQHYNRNDFLIYVRWSIQSHMVNDVIGRGNNIEQVMHEICWMLVSNVSGQSSLQDITKNHNNSEWIIKLVSMTLCFFNAIDGFSFVKIVQGTDFSYPY